MKDLASQPVYPVQLGTRDKTGTTAFENDVVGGLTVREYVAIEFAKHMFGNPALLGSSASMVRKSAIEQADKFIADLCESLSPPVEPVFSGPRKLDDSQKPGTLMRVDGNKNEIQELRNEDGEEHG